MSGISKDQLTGWYELNYKGRKIDSLAPAYLKRAIGWSYHAPFAGHDGIQLAAGLTVRKGKDFVFPYYRDLLLVLAAGLTPKEIFLNGMSKATDPAGGGRHMSNHFGKPEIRIQNVSSLTGNHTQHAAGVGRAIKKYKGDEIVICSIGESSTSEGFVYEAINGVSREKLPVIFVIQDNGYGICVPKSDQSANDDLCDNFSGFPNLKIIKCDGKDPFESYEAMQEARAYCESGEGGAIVYAHCVRIGPHSNSDNHELYRDEAEMNDVRSKDPLPRFRKNLIDNHGFTDRQLQDLEKSWDIEIEKESELAAADPDPDPTTIHQFLIPDEFPDAKELVATDEDEECTLREAINKAMHVEFERNPNTFMWAQDMANQKKEGIFLVSKGMQAKFGKERVFNAPIAEDHIIGTANGFTRYRDDIWVMIEGAEFADYIWPGMEQILECTHEYWRTNGQFSPNIVIRLASGGYIGGGLYHSQNLEGTFSTLPGIRIVIPCFADDAYGLLRQAMHSRGPTLFLEPKHLYNHPITRTRVAKDHMVPFGKAKVRREGEDLSIITYGTTTHFSLDVAKELEEESGASIEVVDLRSIYPLDEEAIIKSVKKTNRCLVVHEDKVRGGFGGEIASLITENCFEYLDAPVNRVGSEFTPVGFSRILERAILIDKARIRQAAQKLLDY